MVVRAASGGRADRPDVGPRGLDVVQASRTGIRAVRHGPAGGDGDVRRPQRVLVLVVDQDQVVAVFVLEGVRHGRAPFMCSVRGSVRRSAPGQATDNEASLSAPPPSVEVWESAESAGSATGSAGPAGSAGSPESASGSTSGSSVSISRSDRTPSAATATAAVPIPARNSIA